MTLAMVATARMAVSVAMIITAALPIRWPLSTAMDLVRSIRDRPMCQGLCCSLTIGRAAVIGDTTDMAGAAASIVSMTGETGVITVRRAALFGAVDLVGKVTGGDDQGPYLIDYSGALPVQSRQSGLLPCTRVAVTPRQTHPDRFLRNARSAQPVPVLA